MGKASRNKRENFEVRRAEAEKKQKEAAAKKRKSTRNKVIAIVCTVLAVLLIGSAVAYNKIVSSGYVLRNTIAATTENYTVDNAIVSYFFHTEYQNFLNQYGNFASYLGLDPQKSLKDQTCAMLSDGGTWFTYFMNSAVSTLKTTLVFCEEAIARGIVLEDADYEVIDAYIDSMETEAKAAGMTKSYFIRAMFGAGMKEKDVRRAMEMSMLYSKCYNQMVSEYTYTEEDYAKYVQDNPKALLHTTYLTMNLSTEDGMLKGDITTDILNQFKTKFEAVKNQEEFETVAYDYLKNYAYKDYTDKTEEDIQTEIDEMLQEDVQYAGGEFMDWAIDASRVENDVLTIMNEEGTSLDVYLMLVPGALHEYDSVNVRHILLSAATYGSTDAAKAKAEALLTEWKDGEATAESFGALAAEYSEDSAENGLYENVIKGDMTGAFDEWLFADGRAVGDTGIVETEYGIHVMYMEGYGLTAWEVEAERVMKQNDFNADYLALQEKYTITVDDLALALLDA